MIPAYGRGSIMNQAHPTHDTTGLLTPQQAAFRLLEGATLEALRTGGAGGILPIRVGSQRMFRHDHVDAFIREKLQGVA